MARRHNRSNYPYGAEHGGRDGELSQPAPGRGEVFHNREFRANLAQRSLGGRLGAILGLQPLSGPQFPGSGLRCGFADAGAMESSAQPSSRRGERPSLRRLRACLSARPSISTPGMPSVHATAGKCRVSFKPRRSLAAARDSYVEHHLRTGNRAASDAYSEISIQRIRHDNSLRLSNLPNLSTWRRPRLLQRRLFCRRKARNAVLSGGPGTGRARPDDAPRGQGHRESRRNLLLQNVGGEDGGLP